MTLIAQGQINLYFDAVTLYGRFLGRGGGGWGGVGGGASCFLRFCFFFIFSLLVVCRMVFFCFEWGVGHG